MSLSYFYVDHDKAQFFDCGLPWLNNRFDRIGTGPGARALAILVSERGIWKGDRISVVSDCSEGFDELVIHGVNVGIEAELMLIEVDGLDWVEESLDRHVLAFERMCSYALLIRHSAITEMLDRKYGVGKWQQRYEKHLQGNTDIWSQKVIDAKNRGLDLLRRQSPK